MTSEAPEVAQVRALAIQQRQATSEDFARRSALTAAAAQKRAAQVAEMQMQQAAAARQQAALKAQKANTGKSTTASGGPAPAGDTTWGAQTAAFQSETGMRHSGGYRTPERNAQVGGVKNSAHMVKDGAGHSKANDFVGTEEQMQAGAARARAMGARQVLVHDAGSGRHLHIEWS